MAITGCFKTLTFLVLVLNTFSVLAYGKFQDFMAFVVTSGYADICIVIYL